MGRKRTIDRGKILLSYTGRNAHMLRGDGSTSISLFDSFYFPAHVRVRAHVCWCELCEHSGGETGLALANRLR